jgi:hypothetical protein
MILILGKSTIAHAIADKLSDCTEKRYTQIALLK